MRRAPTFDDFEPDDDETLRPLDRARALPRLRLASRIVLAAAVVTGLSLAAKGTMNPASTTSAWSEPPRQASAPVARVAVATPSASPILRLEPRENEPAARSEPPRWNPATGLREDALSSGRFDAIDVPFLRVTVTEIGPDTDPPPSLFVTLVRRAAEIEGLSVLRTGPRGEIDTKLGPFELVETSLSGEGTRGCTGFRAIGQTRLRIDGWLCGVLGQAPDARAVACAIDRLGLGGRVDDTLEAIFGDAERGRSAACSSSESARAQKADATGAIAARKPETRSGRKKNEAQMRQIVQAGQ